MLLVQGRISQKYGFQMCLLAVLGSQGIVVKCTAAIFFLTVDYKHRYLPELYDTRSNYESLYAKRRFLTKNVALTTGFFSVLNV